MFELRKCFEYGVLMMYVEYLEHKGFISCVMEI